MNTLRATLHALVAITSLALSARSLAGCVENNLESRTHVKRPRILSVIADPPEVRPGGTVRFHMMLGGFGSATPSHIRWLLCARPEASTGFIAQSSFGETMSDLGCFGGAATDVVEIGNDLTADFTFPENTLSRLEALRAIYGDLLSDATLRNIAERAGIAVTVSVEMDDPNDPAHPLQALKRVVVVNKTDTNVNPPPPHFRFGISHDPTSGARFERSASDPERCETSGSVVVQVAAGRTFEIAPITDEESWIQNYEQLDSSGGISPLRESAFYSWYATEGTFSDSKTRIPTRNTIWTSPTRPGRVTHWLVVRDGRGGASACRYEIDVVAQ